MFYKKCLRICLKCSTLLTGLRFIVDCLIKLRLFKLFFRIMGNCCAAPRKKAYLDSKEAITNRSIPAENETPHYHHGFVGSACGYGFDLQQNDIEQIMKKHMLEKRKQKEIEKWDEVEDTVQQLKTCYKEHNIDDCMLKISKVESLLKKIDFELLVDKSAQKNEIMVFIAELKNQHLEMMFFVGEMEKPWVFQKVEKGLTISSRRDENTVGVLMEREIEVPVEIFLSIVSQVGLFSELIKDVKESREQRTLDRNHKIGYCLYDLPLLNVRQTYFQAFGYNRLNHNKSIFMYSRSIHDKPEICKKLNFTPEVNKDYVQIEYKYLMVQYIPIDQKRGKASIAINIDMKINFVPLGLMEFVCILAFKDFFNLVIEASAKFKGSKWDQKIQKHPEAFNFYKSMIDNYFKKE